MLDGVAGLAEALLRLCLHLGQLLWAVGAGLSALGRVAVGRHVVRVWKRSGVMGLCCDGVCCVLLALMRRVMSQEMSGLRLTD